MGMRLYAGSSGWILVPDCISPPIQADGHGPLHDIGDVDDDALDPRELRSVLEAFDRQSFAVVPNRLGERLQRGIGNVRELATTAPAALPRTGDRDDGSFAQP